MMALPEAEPFTFSVFGTDPASGERILLGSGVGLRQGKHVADAAVAEARAAGAWVMEDYPDHHVAYRVGDVPEDI